MRVGLELNNNTENNMSFKFRITNTAIMSFLLSGFMTIYITWINLGVVENFIHLWLKAWLMAFPAAFVGVLVLTPVVLKLTTYLLKISDNR